MNTLLTIAMVGQAQGAAADEFIRLDPYGVGMALIAMSVVISVLAFASIVFSNLGKIYGIKLKKAKSSEAPVQKATTSSTTGEEMAAIAMALHLYKSAIHDHESTVLTINKIGKAYSPWSSKIYGVMNRPVVNHNKRNN